MASTVSTLQKRVRGILIGLVVQFILGMAVNLFGQPPQEGMQEPIYSRILFIAHSLLGLLLLIGAIVIFVLAKKTKEEMVAKLSLYGMLSIILAFGGGIAVAALGESNFSELASFVMAIGFILAFIFYGKLFASVKK